ncbi:MAG: hypothetical protein AB7K52_09710 [Phycisphaerales bacterium]
MRTTIASLAAAMLFVAGCASRLSEQEPSLAPTLITKQSRHRTKYSAHERMYHLDLTGTFRVTAFERMGDAAQYSAGTLLTPSQYQDGLLTVTFAVGVFGPILTVSHSRGVTIRLDAQRCWLIGWDDTFRRLEIRQPTDADPCASPTMVALLPPKSESTIGLDCITPLLRGRGTAPSLAEDDLPNMPCINDPSFPAFHWTSIVPATRAALLTKAIEKAVTHTSHLHLEFENAQERYTYRFTLNVESVRFRFSEQ